MFSSVAWAADAPSQPGFMDTLPMLAVVFFIFYFLVIRPQGKKIKTHNDFLSKMKRGDKVLTSGGILGTVEGLTDKFVTLEISDDVKVRILRAQISGSAENATEEKK